MPALRDRALVRVSGQGAGVSDARIAALYCYPLKSARGMEMATARLTATGLEHDREWMIVDARDRFVTQREQPRLATLQVTLSDDGRLHLRAPGQAPLTQEQAFTGATRRVRIWRDECSAIAAGEAADRWLAGWLGEGHRLVRFDRSRPRLSSRDWTGGIDAPNLFSDGYPLLLLSQASLDDLAARAGRRFPVERFRPNILLDGVDAYAEDRIDELHAGAVRLKVVKPCTRCIITTTDQSTGARDGDEPLRTLRSYRHDARLQGVLFAQNAVVLDGVGASLHVGQPVHLTLRV